MSLSWSSVICGAFVARTKRWSFIVKPYQLYLRFFLVDAVIFKKICISHPFTNHIHKNLKRPSLSLSRGTDLFWKEIKTIILNSVSWTVFLCCGEKRIDYQISSHYCKPKNTQNKLLEIKTSGFCLKHPADTILIDACMLLPSLFVVENFYLLPTEKKHIVFR